MARDEDLKSLHIEGPISDEKIEAGYRRMLRRYPPEHFPEQARTLREARARLLQSDDYWQALLTGEMTNLSFLVQYARAAPESSAADTKESVFDNCGGAEFYRKMAADYVRRENIEDGSNSYLMQAMRRKLGLDI